MTFVLFTRRTDYPKLGYIIYRLKELGIACRFAGRSFHAEHCLEVDESRLADAWALLGERHGRLCLDDVKDHHPKFLPFAEEQPSHPESR